MEQLADLSQIDLGEVRYKLNLGADGNLYGFGYHEAVQRNVIFKYDIATQQADTVFSLFFDGRGFGSDGAISIQSNGDFYFGGSVGSNRGIFKYEKSSNTFDQFIEFTSLQGRFTQSLKIIDNKLFAINRSGSTNNRGAIFSVDLDDKAVNTLKVLNTTELYNFFGNLLFHSNGKLYAFGVSGGGAGAKGGLVEIDPVTGAVTDYVITNTDFGTYTLAKYIAEGSDGLIYTNYNTFNSFSIHGVVTFNPVTKDFNDLTPSNRLTGQYEGITLACLPPSAFPPGLVFNRCVGEALNITLSSLNTDAYVWKKDGAVLNEATADVLSLNAIKGEDTGTYTAEMTNSCGITEVSFTVVVSDIELSASTKASNSITGSGSIDVTVEGGIEPYTYSWASGETTEDITNLFTGSYELTVTDANGCSIVETFNVEGVLSNKEKLQNTFSCFPNPVKNTLTISTKNAELKSLYLYDLTGTLIQVFRLTQEETEVDVSQLSAGAYYLKSAIGDSGYKLIKLDY